MPRRAENPGIPVPIFGLKSITIKYCYQRCRHEKTFYAPALDRYGKPTDGCHIFTGTLYKKCPPCAQVALAQLKADAAILFNTHNHPDNKEISDDSAANFEEYINQPLGETQLRECVSEDEIPRSSSRQQAPQRHHQWRHPHALQLSVDHAIERRQARHEERIREEECERESIACGNPPMVFVEAPKPANNETGPRTCIWQPVVVLEGDHVTVPAPGFQRPAEWSFAYEWDDVSLSLVRSIQAREQGASLETSI
jgi:hypothetical protein